jgi:hypothetical protein
MLQLLEVSVAAIGTIATAQSARMPSGVRVLRCRAHKKKNGSVGMMDAKIIIPIIIYIRYERGVWW